MRPAYPRGALSLVIQRMVVVALRVVLADELLMTVVGGYTVEVVPGGT